MAIKINLLPAESRVGGDLAKFLRITRMLGVIGIAVFLVFGLGLGAFFIFSTIQLNGLNTANDSLKSQLTQLSTTEAQMVVLKDRVAKIKAAQAIPTAIKNLSNFLPFVSSFSNSSFNELDIDTTKISTTINFKSNDDLTAFMKAISSSIVFQSVSLDSFNYNPATGYLVNLSVTSKK